MRPALKSRIFAGRAFQAVGAAEEKAHLASSGLVVGGTVRCGVAELLNDRSTLCLNKHPDIFSCNFGKHFPI